MKDNEREAFFRRMGRRELPDWKQWQRHGLATGHRFDIGAMVDPI